MSHTTENKKLIQNRLNRIVGQLNGVTGLMDSETDCYKVLQQMTAARGALNTLIQWYLEDHLLEHVVHENDAKKRHLGGEEVVRLIRSYLK